MAWTISMEFSSGQEKSLLIAGYGDDLVRVWDYKRGVCVAKLEGHKNYVMSAFFHPHLPYIFSASSDGEIRVWRQSNYELVLSFPLGVTNLTSMAACKNSNKLVLGAEGQFQVLEINTTEKKHVRTQELKKEKKIELESEEVTRIKLELARKKEEELGEMILKHMNELDKVRADHQEKERMQASRAKQLEDEVRALKSKSTVMGERLANAERRNEELEAERAELAQKVQHLHSEVKNLVAQKTVLVEKLETSTKKIRELELERVALIKDFNERISEMKLRLKNEVAARATRVYSLAELKEATNDFNMTLGSGDADYSESVYSGKLHDGTPIMVKKVRVTSTCRGTDHEDFKDKVVDRLRMLQHPNLLRLLGVCYEENCLVYEGDMANGSLKQWISGGDNHRRGFLPWYVRLRVMAEVARAVCFLHSNRLDNGRRIIHGAIKPANVLLDHNFVAKICGVDWAVLVSQQHCGGEVAADSFHAFLGNNSQYVAPEYLRSSVCSEKTDIYALGVTLLEILTGKFWNALGIVEDAMEDGAAIENALDPNAGCWDVGLAREVAGLGLHCTSLDKGNRPDMATAGVGIVATLDRIAGKVELAAAAEDG
ncbi:hypothetical protein CBR_g1216 [Chara braunii]|uniref:Protein kinase domain-containing protein n=1 Tax=Chara braunii TaxID=69332 RepID=A0A388KDH0_CHABU|nr:hypothetical protein CBR_g1216 [Chara braunii]|eukprot:GBG68095.1 hypothetical protein CBR_g1216 [Chara braunii]